MYEVVKTLKIKIMNGFRLDTSTGRLNSISYAGDVILKAESEKHFAVEPVRM